MFLRPFCTRLSIDLKTFFRSSDYSGMDLRDDDDIEDRRGGVKIHDESNRVCTCACYRAAKPVENREICYLCIYVYHRSQGKELHSTI